jgi:single-strand DNA-binding protein
MLNHCQIIGRLGTDPEVKAVAGGKEVARLNVATTDVWRDRDGNKQERTEWHRVVVWGALANTCANHLRKGSLVYFSGKMQTRSWEDQQGQKKYTTELIANEMKMLSPKEQSSSPELFFNSDDEMPF